MNHQRQLEKLLAKIESLNKENAYWCISRSVGMFLKKMLIDLKVKTAFEIGTSIGYSALWLAGGLLSQNGKLYTLESHSERFKLAGRHFSESGLSSHIIQIKGHAPQIFKTLTLPTKIDFAFVDGVKKGTTSYIEALIPFMNHPSTIIVDNISSHANEMLPFLQWLQKKSIRHKIRTEIGEGLAIISL